MTEDFPECQVSTVSTESEAFQVSQELRVRKVLRAEVASEHQERRANRVALESTAFLDFRDLRVTPVCQVSLERGVHPENLAQAMYLVPKVIEDSPELQDFPEETATPDPKGWTAFRVFPERKETPDIRERLAHQDHQVHQACQVKTGSLVHRVLKEIRVTLASLGFLALLASKETLDIPDYLDSTDPLVLAVSLARRASRDRPTL